MKKLAIDIIGCGSIVRSNHVRIINTLSPDLITPLGCYDPNRGASKVVARLLSCQMYRGLDDVMSSPSNAVLIATPPSLHFELCLKSIRAGKNVLCEKPFVVSLDQAQSLVAAARQQHVSLLVGHFRRFFPSLQGVRQYLSGQHSVIKSIHAFEGGRYDWNTESDYVSQDPTGNVVFDTGSHLFDMVIFALSLDKEEGSISLKSIVKTPSTEPCHEASFECKINSRKTPVTLFGCVSRLSPQSNMIRFLLEDEEVWLKTTYADSFLIRRNGVFFESKSRSVGRYISRNVNDCFALEYLWLSDKVASNGELESPLDADRFELLTKTLSQMSDFRSLIS